jgi:predicted AAA+ superfamily ATPase
VAKYYNRAIVAGMSAAGLVDRRALRVLERRLDAARVVVVNGPRQSGKTELLRLLHRQRGGGFVTLDQRDDLRVARTDPTGLVTGIERPTVIDEVQRGGDPLLLAIKAEVDRSNEPGQFLLAGSTRFLSEPRLSESLAGRVRFVDLWPFSIGEVFSAPDRLIDLLFTETSTLRETTAAVRGITRAATMQLVARGGFPEAVRSTDEINRTEFLDSYARTVAERDIRELVNVNQRVEMLELMRHMAARSGSVLNTAALAQELRMSSDSTRRYLPLLETIYFHHLLPAWSRNLSARQRNRPKLHVYDTGLAASLLGLGADRLARPTESLAGPLFETFVVNELAKQATWSTERVRLFHWRDRDDREVDVIIETPDGRIAAVEVKAAVDAGTDDARWLAYLRDLAGDAFINGVVIHCGDRMRPLGDRLTALPVSAIWAA